MNISGTPNIGVYALTTNDFTLVPLGTPTSKVKSIEQCLGTKVIRLNPGGTRLIGVLGVANSSGIILPDLVSDEDIKVLKDVYPANIERIESKVNAFGNLVLTNDHGAIISEFLTKESGTVKKIEDTLDVELVSGRIAGLPQVGSAAVASNKGVLAHPMLNDDERKVLEDILKVHVDVGTINGGCPFVASGVLANDKGVVIGNLTTGPEILMISSVLE